VEWIKLDQDTMEGRDPKKTSGSIQDGEFLDKLRDYRIFKVSSALLSY
jgi:hypothetical protein